jgi:hypothetical protein
MKRTFLKITIVLSLVILGGMTIHSALGQSGSTDSGRCVKRFDRFRNRDTVVIEPHTIYHTDSDELKLGASAVIEGEGNSVPREIDLLFDSTASRLRYGNSA